MKRAAAGRPGPDGTSEPREVELKFLLDPARTLAVRAHVADCAKVRPRTLTSVYFDTDDRILWRSGLTLRLRKDGADWTQTIKSSQSAKGAFGRGEWESPAPGGILDVNGLAATPAGVLLTERTVSPLFEVVVVRRALELTAGQARIELSLDSARVIAGGRVARFSELELELKAGPIHELWAMAEDLQRRCDLELSFVTKADRGFSLVEPTSGGAVRFKAPVLDESMTVGEVFKALARAALRQIVGAAARLRGQPTAEAIHQLRVAARRLRGTLASFAPILDDERRAPIEAELRWLAGELDPARNLDVLLGGAVGRARRRRNDRPGTSALAASLKERRKAAYARVRHAAASPRLRALELNVLNWIEVGPWTRPASPSAAARDRPIGPFAARALAKARRRLARRSRRFDTLDREGRHRARIAAKRLRYAAEGFAQIFSHPRRARRFLETVKALLDRLGELNDIATGEILLGEGAAAETVKASERGREKALAAEAGRLLRRFDRARPFWPDT